MKSKNKLFLILIDGPMGSGKTTVAKILHEKLKRTAHIGLDRVKRYISDFKKNPHDNNISRNIVLAMTQEYLRQDINVIIEQGMKKYEIENFKKAAKKYNAHCFVFQLEAPKPLLESRVLARTQSLGKKITKTRINRNYKIHIDNKYENAIVFDSEKLSPEQIVKFILKEMRK